VIMIKYNSNLIPLARVSRKLFGYFKSQTNYYLLYLVVKFKEEEDPFKHSFLHYKPTYLF
jgi:hypothetical protein